MSGKNGNQQHNHPPSFSFFEAWKGESVFHFNGLPEGQSSKSRDGRNPQQFQPDESEGQKSSKSRDGRNPQRCFQGSD